LEILSKKSDINAGGADAMAIQELASISKNRSKFDPEKRVNFHHISKLLAKCSEDLDGEWNCVVVPQHDICQSLRPQSELREDCEGHFIAVLITQSAFLDTHNPQNQTNIHVTRRSLFDFKRRLQQKSTKLSDWVLRLIYTAQGMDLLVKPLFHFQNETVQESLLLPEGEVVRLILLIGFPANSEQTPTLSRYIRFYARHDKQTKDKQAIDTFDQ
jgi:hypothetical protein